MARLQKLLHVASRVGIAVLFVLQLSYNKSGNQIGPCVHMYEEPILHIQSVTNAQTGAEVETVTLTDITIDSTRVGSLLPNSREQARCHSRQFTDMQSALFVWHGKWTVFFPGVSTKVQRHCRHVLSVI